MDSKRKDIDDHAKRCRLCLSLISEFDIFYQLSEQLAASFKVLTNLVLDLINKDLSCLICVLCQRNLSRLVYFRNRSIQAYDQLREIILEIKTKQIEHGEHDEEDQCHKNETSAKLKSPTSVYKNHINMSKSCEHHIEHII
jgi:hypothetical protein